MPTSQSIDINLNITMDGNSGSSTILGKQQMHSKIEIDLTVSELAAMCRIFYDLGFFTNSNKSEILNIISQNFTSSNAFGYLSKKPEG